MNKFLILIANLVILICIPFLGFSQVAPVYFCPGESVTLMGINTITNCTDQLGNPFIVSSNGHWTSSIGEEISNPSDFQITIFPTQSGVYTYTTTSPMCPEGSTGPIGPSNSINYLVLLDESCPNVGNWEVELQVTLEGSLNSSTNEVEISSEYPIPSGQPFHNPPNEYYGFEFFHSYVPYLNSIVDWVLVELHIGTPNTDGTGTVPINRKAGLLLNDNIIYGVDEVTAELMPLTFEEVNLIDDYYIVIRHKNHLDIMTSGSIVPDASNNYQNTIPLLHIDDVFGVEQLKFMGTNNNGEDVYAMYAGEGTWDGVIQTTDYDLWSENPAILNQYVPTDYNLDGSVQSTDYDLWFLNKAKIGNAPLIQE